MAKKTKTIRLNVWQIAAVERGIEYLIEKEKIHGADARALLEKLRGATRVTVTK